jgi:arylamine N-acetyltransferase
MDIYVRNIFTLVLCYCFTLNVMSQTLEAYQYKNRLILFSVPDAKGAKNLHALLDKSRADLEERDVKIIDLSPNASRLPNTVRLSDKENTLLRKKFRVSQEETQAIFILIGKDGGEKARQTTELDLTKWFTLIDQMPMRVQERQRSAEGQK